MKFRVDIPGFCLYPGEGDHWWRDNTGEDILRMARRADELGFDIIRIPEHLVMHEDWVRKMGPRWVHSVTTAGIIAAATRRITVVPIFIIPYRHPVDLAKAIATIDYFSGGRLAFLAAAGYMEWQNELLQTPPYSERRAVTDEYLEAMIELWTADRPRFEGKYVSFSDIVFDPRPVQKPYPPIWMAGNSKSAVKRAARLGDGWSPNGISRQRVRQELAWMREQPSFAERERPFDVYLNLFEGEIDLDTHTVLKPPVVSREPDAVLEQVQELADIGVTYTDCEGVLGASGIFAERGSQGWEPVRSVEEYIERLEWFAAEIMPEGRRIGAPTAATR
jgi:probable F420-dependent oxidoreductase